MTISDVYAKYRIMPNLQLHQLRVAAVAKLVADDFDGQLDKDSLILAALLHDMGNIIKFDLSRYPEFVEPEGLQYWESVKREFVSKYGAFAHGASVRIGRELGLSDRILQLIDNVSISLLAHIVEGDDYEQKIVEYADDRVGPHGVLSIRERFDDMVPRYAHRYKNIDAARAKYDEYEKSALKIEHQLFTNSTFRPQDINDDSTAPIVEELKHFQVK